ncbi:MAG: hypothetical protein ACYCO9_00455 [Streptosporangiaceae bacterium]
MTSYSVLRSAQRAIVLATWPGAWSDHSANITTLADGDEADCLASALTRISEDAWDAAAFLDASPALELAISALIGQLRGQADKIEPVSIPGDGYRHAGQWSFIDAAEVLASDAPAALSVLTRPQRLTVADELAADAAERASAAQVLGSGNDPASGKSRGWQMCEVTRSLRNGQVGPLPEGAAGWLVRSWGPDLGPAERWEARHRLVRIEQLVAACKAHGGRAGTQDDPLLAHLVVPHPGRDEDDEVIYVSVHSGTGNSWGTAPATPMTVTGYRGKPAQQNDLGKLDPRDDDEFARIVGPWTRQVPFWPGNQVGPVPGSA